MFLWFCRLSRYFQIIKTFNIALWYLMFPKIVLFPRETRISPQYIWRSHKTRHIPKTYFLSFWTRKMLMYLTLSGDISCFLEIFISWSLLEIFCFQDVWKSFEYFRYFRSSGDIWRSLEYWIIFCINILHSLEIFRDFFRLSLFPRDIWRSLETFPVPWQYLAIPGDIWRYLEILKKYLHSLEIFGDFTVPVNISFSLEMFRDLWRNLEVFGVPWRYLKILHSLEIFLFPWRYFEISVDI